MPAHRGRRTKLFMLIPNLTPLAAATRGGVAARASFDPGAEGPAQGGRLGLSTHRATAELRSGGLSDRALRPQAWRVARSRRESHGPRGVSRQGSLGVPHDRTV